MTDLIIHYDTLMRVLKQKEDYETSEEYHTLLSLNDYTKKDLLELHIRIRGGNVNNKRIADMARVLKIKKPIGFAKALLADYNNKNRGNNIDEKPLTMHTQKALANLKEITLPDWAALQLEDHLAESIIDVSAMPSLIDRAESLRNRFFESQ